MRPETNRGKIKEFMRELGAAVRGPGRVYLTGGSTALLHGWRDTTIDIDLKADPEPPGLFEAIATLKDSLGVNIELAAPSDFIPEVPGWRERSPFIARHGALDFLHYDPVSQCLSKLERGHARDLADAAAMAASGLVSRGQVWSAFLEIEPLLIRFPAIDAPSFRRAVQAFASPDAPPAA